MKEMYLLGPNEFSHEKEAGKLIEKRELCPKNYKGKKGNEKIKHQE